MSQSIEFPCPSCQTSLRVPAEMAGVSGPCPTCNQTIVAPTPQPVPIATPDLFAQPAQAPTPVPQQQQAPAPQQAPVPQQAAAPPIQQAPQPASNLPPNRSPGEIPHQQVAGNPADPRSLNSASTSPATPLSRADNLAEHASAPPAQSSPKRRFWPIIVFPALFIGLSIAAIYLILDIFGFFEPKEIIEDEPELTPSESIMVAPSSEQPAATPSVIPVTPPANAVPGVTPPSAHPVPDDTIRHDSRDLESQNKVPSSLPEVVTSQKKTLWMLI